MIRKLSDFVQKHKTKLRKENLGLARLLLLSKIYSFLPSNSNLHVVGDSHALSFTHVKFNLHYLGPTTAFNLNKENSSTKSREKLYRHLDLIKDKENSLIIFVFGEIDCRLHIYYQFMKNNKKVSINALIRKTVTNYISEVVNVKKIGFNIAVFNVVPPGEQPNIYNYPYYADRATMFKITQEFNEELAQQCKNREITFINIFDLLISKNKSRRKDLTLDSIHFNTKLSNIVLEAIASDKKLSKFAKS